MPDPKVLRDVLQQLLARAASGELRIDTERIPLADIENAWGREQRARLVIIP